MYVENMQSSRGNDVPNQFVIQDREYLGGAEYPNRVEYFQSYKTIIAKKTNDVLTHLDEKAWNYSRTTSKYRNMFTGLTTKETLKKIKSGEIELVDLNNK